MKIFLILLALIVILPSYAFVGFFVFMAVSKVCDRLDRNWQSNAWRRYWRDNRGMAMMFLAFWPVLVTLIIVVIPFSCMYYLIKKLLEREESRE